MTVFENDGAVSIQVERSEGLNRRILMNVATVDGTALGKIRLKQHACIKMFLLIAGRDYTTTERKITFLSGQSKVIVNIPILDDAVTEESDIYFFVNIIFNTNTIAQSVITIINDDHGKLNLIVLAKCSYTYIPIYL